MKRVLRVGCLLLAVAACTIAGAATPGARTLRLMTYNIRLDLASDGANAWPHRRDGVVAQIAWLHPDVFGLQEVLPNQKSDLAGALPQYRLFGGGRDGDDRGEASPIGYDTRRFEFLDGGVFWLSPTPNVPSKGWDAALNRIATWARLRDRGTRQSLLVVNTHWDHVGEVARQQSAAQIARWIADHRKGCEPLAVTGDFNTALESEPLQALQRAAGLRDARAASKSPPVGPVGTFNGFEISPAGSAAIDHILVEPRVTVDRYLVLVQFIDGRWPSDHFPVLVDATFPDCSG